METAKERVIKFIQGLPSNLTEEEITYHLYVRDEIFKARKQSAEGKLLSHSEVKEKYKKWLP
jgi:hypothetical protein